MLKLVIEVLNLLKENYLLLLNSILIWLRHFDMYWLCYYYNAISKYFIFKNFKKLKIKILSLNFNLPWCCEFESHHGQ